MAQVVSFTRHGGPEVLTTATAPAGDPGPGQIRLAQTFAGVNFIDTYFRSGLYPVQFPFVSGQEGVGVVTAVGADVAGIAVGDRVGYLTPAGGGYASERLIPADIAIPLPDDINDKVAAALILKGLTVQMLLRQTFRVAPGMTVLVHAAAGGVGSLLAQWAALIGARVIGTAGSAEKLAIARQNGCSDVIDYTQADFAAAVCDITGGALCDVVYDGVGKATAMGSLDCLRPRGIYVNYGNASGVVDALNMRDLGARGSLYATRPMIFHYTKTRQDTVAMAAEMFAVLRNPAIHLPQIKVFPLSQAAAAHDLIESRRHAGCIVLDTQDMSGGVL